MNWGVLIVVLGQMAVFLVFAFIPKWLFEEKYIFGWCIFIDIFASLGCLHNDFTNSAHQDHRLFALFPMFSFLLFKTLLFFFRNLSGRDPEYAFDRSSPTIYWRDKAFGFTFCILSLISGVFFMIQK